MFDNRNRCSVYQACDQKHMGTLKVKGNIVLSSFDTFIPLHSKLTRCFIWPTERFSKHITIAGTLYFPISDSWCGGRERARVFHGRKSPSGDTSRIVCSFCIPGSPAVGTFRLVLETILSKLFLQPGESRWLE